MPNNVRDTWQYLRPVVETVKNKKKIVIPAFSAPCGFKNTCIESLRRDTGDLISTGVGTILNGVTTKITVEAWVKVGFGFKNSSVYPITFGYCGGVPAQWTFGIYPTESNPAISNKLYCAINTDVDTYLVYSIAAFPDDNKWHHVAFTFNNNVVPGLDILGEGTSEPILGEGGENVVGEGVAIGTTGELNLYLDGVYQDTTITQGVLIPLNGQLSVLSVLGESVFFTKMSDLRIWNVVRTNQQIMDNSHTLRSAFDGGLVLYWRFREGSGLIATDTINGIVLTITTANIDWATDQPGISLGFGASFIPHKEVCESSGPLSLKFPVRKPHNSNNCLCVSWIDDDGIFQRRKLYGGVGEDINPNPADYNGEHLNKDFTLEFWNIDGEETIDLVEDLTIYTSHTSAPNTGIDHNIASDLTPVGTSKLAAPFPWTFPVTFDQQQTY